MLTQVFWVILSTHSDNETQTQLHWWKDREPKEFEEVKDIWEITRTKLLRGEQREERLKEAITQHVRLRFLPWWERWLYYSPSNWPEAGVMSTHDRPSAEWLHLPGVGRGAWKMTVSVMGKTEESQGPSPKSQCRVLAQITSPASRSVTWSTGGQEHQRRQWFWSGDLPFPLKSKLKKTTEITHV